MKPFRKNVAIAIDGGGIKGVIVTRALASLERHLSKPVHDIFRLAAGTSTGSIISAGIGAGTRTASGAPVPARATPPGTAAPEAVGQARRFSSGGNLGHQPGCGSGHGNRRVAQGQSH